MPKIAKETTISIPTIFLTRCDLPLFTCSASVPRVSWLGGRGKRREYLRIYRGPEAFFRSSGSAPRPTPPPLSRQQLVSHCQSSCVSPVELTDGRGGGEGWRGAKSYDREYGWSINLSLLFRKEYLETIDSLFRLTRCDPVRQRRPYVPSPI
jgi:hypothetical protein